MTDNDLHFYDNGKEIMVIGDPFGPTQVPDAKLHIEEDVSMNTVPVKLDLVDDGCLIFPSSQCPSTCLNVKEEIPLMRVTDQDGNVLLCTHADDTLQIGTVPKAPIHIVIGADEYTDADIRRWAKGDTEENLDGWTGLWLLIEYLSQIIVNLILDKSKVS